MTAALEKQRLAGKMKIFYVLPDYYESRPKPCMQGWGRRYLTVNPSGRALPCPTATSIPNLVFDSVRDHSLGWIWTESDSFNRFRGTEWMPELCRSCPRHEIDFGGCRCQAALITGDAARIDPVCELSPDRWLIDAACAGVQNSAPQDKTWTFRQNPTHQGRTASRPSSSR
jgi:PqqA peptide cyclase